LQQLSTSYQGDFNQLTDIDDNIIKTELAEIVANLLRDAPSLTQAPYLSSGLVCQLIKDRRVGREEVLQLLLLDARLQCLLVSSNLGWSGLWRRCTRTTVLLLALRWVSGWRSLALLKQDWLAQCSFNCL
jgi:hypothetical protein